MFTIDVELSQRSATSWLLESERVAKKMKREGGSVMSGGGRRRGGGGACRVVVLEIGCGVTVKTMRHASTKAAQSFAAGGADATVTMIRVNPSYPLKREGQDLPSGVSFIALMERTMEALQGIDAALEAVELLPAEGGEAGGGGGEEEGGGGGGGSAGGEVSDESSLDGKW